MTMRQAREVALRLHTVRCGTCEIANGEAVTVGCECGPKRIGLAAIVVTSGCATSEAARAYPEIADRAGARIDDVRFLDAEPFSRDTLLTLTETKPSRCNFLGLPICVPFTRIGREEHHL